VPLQLHYGLNDEHIPKSEIDTVSTAAAATVTSRFNFIRAPGTASSTGHLSPDDVKAVETAGRLTSSGF
jgi:hypothetical protein